MGRNFKKLSCPFYFKINEFLFHYLIKGIKVKCSKKNIILTKF